MGKMSELSALMTESEAKLNSLFPFSSVLEERDMSDTEALDILLSKGVLYESNGQYYETAEEAEKEFEEWHVVTGDDWEDYHLTTYKCIEE